MCPSGVWKSKLVKLKDQQKDVTREPEVLLTFCVPEALAASLMEPSEHFRHKVTKSDSALLSLCGSLLRACERSTSESSPERSGDPKKTPQSDHPLFIQVDILIEEDQSEEYVNGGFSHVDTRSFKMYLFFLNTIYCFDTEHTL